MVDPTEIRLVRGINELTLGEHIAKLRKDRGLSRRDLADLTGTGAGRLPEPTIYQIERGRCPSIDTLRKLARAMGVAFIIE